MQRMSHTLHLSVKEHSISNRRSATGVDAHNNRKYQEQSNENINFENTKFNTTLIGSDNITKDISNVYHELFDEALASYNEKQTRKDRIIPDYMEHIANSKQQSIAEEFIIQFGKYDSQDSLHLGFENEEDVENIKNAYSDYLEELQRQIPNFKIANATLHMDEKNPHLHVVGVPYAEGYKKGLTKQVAKSRTFDNKLSTLQDVMGQKMVDVMKEHLDLDVYHEKQAGRNKNYRAEEVAEQNKIIKEQQAKIELLENELDSLESKINLSDMSLKFSNFQLKEIKNELDIAKQTQEDFEQHFLEFIYFDTIDNECYPLLEMLEKSKGEHIPKSVTSISEKGQAIAFKIAQKLGLTADQESADKLRASYNKSQSLLKQHQKSADKLEKRAKHSSKRESNELEL